MATTWGHIEPVGARRWISVDFFGFVGGFFWQCQWPSMAINWGHISVPFLVSSVAFRWPSVAVIGACRCPSVDFGGFFGFVGAFRCLFWFHRWLFLAMSVAIGGCHRCLSVDFLVLSLPFSASCRWFFLAMSVAIDGFRGWVCLARLSLPCCGFWRSWGENKQVSLCISIYIYIYIYIEITVYIYIFEIYIYICTYIYIYLFIEHAKDGQLGKLSIYFFKISFYIFLPGFEIWRCINIK